jgi:FAD/FMN-containing dehydrogenase
MSARRSRRDILASGVAVAAASFVPRSARSQQRIVMNDASRLNPTPVFKHWRPTSNPSDALSEALRAELKAASAEHRPVVIGGARHSMGGHSLARDGVGITFDAVSIIPDVTSRTYRVSAGARWADVIKALDPIGFSPVVMQSNSDFGIASTFSVNSHGWPVPFGPFGSTVRSLRMMLASGDIVECSREKNQELFSLAMGGYGLFGIILDLTLDMTFNVLLQPKAELLEAETFAERFSLAINNDHAVLMAYGRLSIARSNFFRDAIMVTYHAVPDQPPQLPEAISANGMTSIAREIYRAQIGHEWAKRARWYAESTINPLISNGVATRNTLMDEPVSNLASADPWRTDILHEYFVPPERFGEFLVACRETIPQAQAEFLNVTLRYVGADTTATLAYAPSPRIAAVMSFSQEVTPDGEIDMLQTTEKLIDRIVGLGGSFYLPYRLHARRDQIATAYPKAGRFAERKRYYDPSILFRHAMWDAYFA